MPASPLAFRLPRRLEAGVPAEARGLRRDGVRLLAARRGDGRIAHATFADLPAFLEAGDLLVINTSATLPAAVPARRAGGAEVMVHFAGRAPTMPGDRWWVVELRSAGGGQPVGGTAGERLRLAGGAAVEIVAAYVHGGRLWLGRVESDAPVVGHLGRHGRPIRYGYVAGDWPLAAYQTVYANAPGSAEMPSAGRPFTPELLTRLVAGGVAVAPVVLHAGVSSPERHEPPVPEYYRVPAATAALVNATRERGGRVVAVGTTVVRALETVSAPAGGRVESGEGWTDLVVAPERGLRTVDGLISGWHEPDASHLDLLAAAAGGGELLAGCYRAALDHGYLWHEFGDSHLIMP
jgi:S-adenosylmethionine:tRNA ribosyltransferase-isomerase